ncbi:glycoside hydrolase 5 family protein [Legionella clemsonensis]|uniref:Beta-xylosidase n=1 Tax=Legionella clemsonensis TaxID=1867846 RepID=A0A222NYV2_9GAMM|nr:hypothetical protein [Legionella clemsonensis]ASQ44773.1 hypothetical protein clem_01035 [Legionella clemsonensis]
MLNWLQGNPLQDTLGICQWFHYEDYASVERAREFLLDLGIRHLRTGISWADFHRPRGADWYNYQMEALKDFEVLLSVWHTPPSRAEGEGCNSPPRRLDDYADFIEQVICEYGHTFATLELWNEPNNRYKWDFTHYDPHWEKFGTMVGAAAKRAHGLGRRTVLGGIMPVDSSWLRLMESYRALEHIDIIAIHGFPEMWWDSGPINWEQRHMWRGWTEKIDSIRPIAGERPVWITETGLATWHLAWSIPGRYNLQVTQLEQAIQAPAERLYWYSLIDLDPQREAIEGFHVDENEYHLGLVTFDGQKKPAYWRFKELLQASSTMELSSEDYR